MPLPLEKRCCHGPVDSSWRNSVERSHYIARQNVDQFAVPLLEIGLGDLRIFRIFKESSHLQECNFN